MSLLLLNLFMAFVLMVRVSTLISIGSSFAIFFRDALQVVLILSSGFVQKTISTGVWLRAQKEQSVAHHTAYQVYEWVTVTFRDVQPIVNGSGSLWLFMAQSIHNLVALFNRVIATSHSLTITPPFSMDEETHNDLVFIRPHHCKFPNTNLVGRLDNLTLCHAHHILMDLSLVFREMQPSARVGAIRQVALELLKYDDDMEISESTERGFLLAADIVCHTSNVDRINRCLRFQFMDTEEDLINNA